MKNLVLLVALLISFVGCNEISEKEVTLSELQVEACNIADEAGTCDTRLIEVGIVLKEKCCQILGKCC